MNKLLILLLLLILFSCKKESGVNDTSSKDTLNFTYSSIFPSYPFINSTYALIVPEFVTRLNSVKGYDRYKWSTGDTTSFIIIEKPGDYWCYNYNKTIIDTGFFYVYQRKSLFDIPSVFTPNDDGCNDYFTIGSSEFIPYYDFRILDINRNLVFESIGDKDTINIYWKGTYNDNNPAPNATYYYYLNTNRNNRNAIVYRGTVQLIR